MIDPTAPHVLVLSLGGTIAMSQDAAGLRATPTAQAGADEVRTELAGAQVTHRAVANVGSPSVRTAIAPSARRLRVLVVFDGLVHLADRVSKVSSRNVDAFASEPSGPVALVRELDIRLVYRPTERSAVVGGDLPAALPRVPNAGVVAGRMLGVGGSGRCKSGGERRRSRRPGRSGPDDRCPRGDAAAGSSGRF